MRYHRRMGQLLVRNVSDEGVSALKRLAAENGRSVEAQHRELIEALACGEPGEASARDWLAEADRLREMTRGRSGVPSWVLIREVRDAR